MLRGINKQQVFFDDDDYYVFLNSLSKCKTVSGFKLYAYCFMNNHVHLLIQECDEPIDKIFKRLGDSFIYWYNLKYDRIGGVFQGRYKSIPVEGDEYFISVLRYIHQNPVKAGIVKRCSDYEFSSYNAYFEETEIVDTEFAKELIGIKEFKRIHKEICNEHHLDIDDKHSLKLSDMDAKRIIYKRTGCKSPEEFVRLSVPKQKEYVRTLRDEGVSVRQIILFTGASQRTATLR